MSFCRASGRQFIFRVASDSDCEREHGRLRLWRDRRLYDYGLKRADVVATQTTVQADMLRASHALEASVVNMLVEPPRHRAVEKDIDVLWLGHFDLTNFLGIPGEFESPRYLDAVNAIVGAARRHGKGLGFMAADATWAGRYRKLGFNVIAAGLDSSLLQAAIRSTLAPLKEIG